jgi:predicted phosphodiesterase
MIGASRLTRLTLVAWLVLLAAVRGEGTNEQSPSFRPLPPITIDQNSTAPRFLDLWDYAIDGGTPKDSLLFNVVGPRKYQYEGSANLTVSQNRYLAATPTRNWVGDESWSVEVSDGVRAGYATLRVTVRSSQAGTLVEAEDSTKVVRYGDWVEREHQGARFVMSNRPGDRLVFRFSGRQLAARVWTGDLDTAQRYYEGRYENDRYGFLSDWKTYPGGNAQILLDAQALEPLDLARQEPGWHEILLGSDLTAGNHELELRVRDGYVMVDQLRWGEEPFARVDLSATDEFGTPLSDVVVTFRRPHKPDIEVRTDHRGKHDRFFGVPPGIYSVSARADTNPGYLPADPVDENLSEWTVRDVSVRAGESNTMSVRLSYLDRNLRSLGTIRRPHGTLPSLVRAGDDLRIECVGISQSRSLQLRLVNSMQERVLEIRTMEPAPVRGSDGTVAGLHIVARVPDDMAAGVWDLHLTNGAVSDKVSRAVGVRRQPPGAYRFVHISDLHIQNSTRNHAREDRLIALAKEINLLSPAFVIMTGDLTDVGARSEYLRLLTALRSFSVPTFAVPGNHDHYNWWTRYLYRGRDEYARYLGESFYAFSLGVDRYIGVDTSAYEKVHNKDLTGIYADQWSFLTRELTAADRSKGLTAVFSHYDHTSVLGRRYPVSHQLDDLIRAKDVDVYLHGHLHRSFEEPGRPLVLSTGSSQNGEYRVIDVRDSAVVRHPLLQQGQLAIQTLTGGDATTASGQARIENRSAYAFDDLEVGFLLSASPSGYQVDGGRLVATVVADDGLRTKVVIACNLGPGEQRLVSVRPR